MNAPIVPTFFDLRRFAAASITAVADAPDRRDPFAAHRVHAIMSGPTAAGRCTLPASTIAFQDFPFDEILAVIAGDIEFATPSALVRVGPGQAALIPRGTSGRIVARDGASWAFMTYAGIRGDEARARTVEVLSPDAALEPSGGPAADLLIGDMPQCRSHSVFENASEEWSVGLWDSTPYQRRAMTYGHDEFMFLLDGAVRIADGAGRAQMFQAGDMFFVPRGAKCSWHSTVYVRKFYGIYRPA
jgi:uncharacterized cupin superfamily protein